LKPFDKDVRLTLKEVRHEIKEIKKDKSIQIKLSPLKLYIRLFAISLVVVSVLYSLNYFFGPDKSNSKVDYSYTVKSTPTATKTPVVEDVNRIALNGSDIQSLKTGTNIKAAMDSLYSLDLFWFRTSSSTGSINNQFIPVTDQNKFATNRLLGIGTINGKHILVLGAKSYTSMSSSNPQPILVAGKILDLDTTEAVNFAIAQVVTEKIKGIEHSNIITNKYIAVDRAVTTSDASVTSDFNGIYDNRLSTGYKSSTSIYPRFPRGVTQLAFLIIIIGIITRSRRA